MSGPRYVVGIDLGTTNSAAAYVALDDPQRQVHTLAIAQLVREGAVADRPTLPSFLYVAGRHELAPGALHLPWDESRDYAIGEFAREQGARVPGHLVSSAKSWLCHGGVDREAPILPWGGADDVTKLSPVTASARYLQHLREAWAQRFPKDPLDRQDVVLTVPASFDEVARELTVAAAKAAGLERVVLLEEPQAAFYAWVHRHENRWEDDLGDVKLAVVIDVGGGTTDFSLIGIRRSEGRLLLERHAVGDHILLGGDNIDVALARLLEPRLRIKLDSQRWHQLTNLCRAAKETLLGEDAPAEVPVRLVGRSGAVVGGTVTTQLAAHEVRELVLDGFFRSVDGDAEPRTQSRAALQEWGLPFAADPEIPRHLAGFLRRHRDDLPPEGDGPLGHPDAILFNGGALKPAILRDRLQRLVGDWSGREPRILSGEDLDLAVARGAAYYGLVRRGRGIRIGGGSPRAYYVGLANAAAPADSVSALCIAHRGMHEGEEIEVGEPTFEVVANQAVAFPLFMSSTRLGDHAGDVVAAPADTLSPLPPIRTVLRFGKKLEARRIPVSIITRLTEIGTLELWCHSRTTDHRWRLQFQLRDQGTAAATEEEAAVGNAEAVVSEAQLAAASDVLRAVFPSGDSPATGDPVGLARALEAAMGTGKDAWPLAAIRRLWDVLWEGRAHRGDSDAHEARWLNLCGFLLRPGFGAELDDWRMQQLWRMRSEGLRFPRAVQGRSEWASLWKRIAGGLNRQQQIQLFQEVAPALLTRAKAKAKLKVKATPQEVREFWQLMASCERLPPETRRDLGDELVATVKKGKAGDLDYWVLGRLGARAPFYGPINQALARSDAQRWVEALLAAGPNKAAHVFALVQLARCVGDRERDLDPALRQRVADAVRRLPTGDRAARLVSEHVPLAASERARILDESLPAGLHVRVED
jgi:molecular chaperone DnaK (HSP70)